LTAADRFNHLGLLENAVHVLIEGIKVDPDDQRLHYALADIFMENKKFSEALGVLENMPESLRQNVKWLENIALCKKGLQLNAEAGSYADKALLLNSASPMALSVKGLIAFENGSQSEAEDFFRKALAIDSGFAPAYLNISGLRWFAGDKAAALDLSEKAFILCPLAADIAMGYYSTAVSMSQLEKAESLFKEAASLYPANRRLKSMLIDMYIRMEKYADAMKMVEETMISYGIDENTLAAALELRGKVGPMEVQNGADSISLCMIVKDEQFEIGHCLWKIRPAVDELIVVDTGSRDRTKDIAKAFGAKVYDFPWTDDFSAARNFALSKASGSSKGEEIPV
jgi:tetratricopeptide (TPR) repeat protein